MTLTQFTHNFTRIPSTKKLLMMLVDIHDLGIKKSHKQDLTRLDRKDCKLFFAEYKVAFIDEMMRKGKG